MTVGKHTYVTYETTQLSGQNYNNMKDLQHILYQHRLSHGSL